MPLCNFMNGSDALSIERTQKFLDEVTTSSLSPIQREWYQVDIAALLSECKLVNHMINPDDGSALLFLNSSVIHCKPNKGTIKHYPKQLVHCFVDDHRHSEELQVEEPIFKCELFSITPHQEQLCWLVECYDEYEIPNAESIAAKWLAWLNQ